MAQPPAEPGTPLDGLLLVDKPAGISSHAVVASIRNAVGKGIRVGHAGTLDPFATGLMLVLVGRGTRTSQYATALSKRYETLAQLGALSTTGDPEGEITVTGNVPASPLPLPTGEITQVPPAYSAIRIDGVRAYKRVRRGETVEVPARTVTLYEFRELGRDGERVRLEVHCSSGTYVRTLVADLGDGYCLELRRTAVGDFRLADALPLDQFTDRASVEQRLIPLQQALHYLPTFALGPEQARAMHHGRPLERAHLPAELPEGVPVLLVDDAGAIAVGQADSAQMIAVVGFRA